MGTLSASPGIATFGGSANNFTNVVQPTSNDGAALGSSSYSWSDLFLANGGLINFNNGNITITHSAGDLALAGGTLTLLNTGLHILEQTDGVGKGDAGGEMVRGAGG